MKNKKGFTLIELLAVIVILAIIALIAIPMIGNIIEKVKINSAIQSTYGYVNSVNNKLAINQLNSSTIKNGTYDFFELETKYKGMKPSHGTVTIASGVVTTGDFCVNGYSIRYENEKAVYVETGGICPEEHKFTEPEGTLLSEICEKDLEIDTSDQSNAYKLKKVEDLVCLSNLVNDDNITFENINIYLVDNIDISNTNSYKNSNNKLYGDINGDGKIDGLKTELTTEKGFNPIGTSSFKPFKGILKGYGFTISNLYINRPEQDNIGIIGYMEGTKSLVRGINISNIDVKGNNYVGGLVGNLYQGTIREVVISGKVTGNEHVGGIAGYTYHYPYAKIESFIANMDVTGVNLVGGIVGDYNTGTVARGILESGTITATGEDGVSGKVIGVSGGTDHSQDTYVLSSVENIGATNGLNGKVLSDTGAKSMAAYDGKIDTWIGGDNDNSGYYFDYDQNGNLAIYSVEVKPITFDLAGSGTDADPYIINSADDWKKATLKVSDSNCFKLGSDIDFKNRKFYMFGTMENRFIGKLLGDGYTIKNINISGGDNTGIIGYMEGINSLVQAINISNIDVKGNNYVGGIVGKLYQGTIREVVISGKVTGNEHVGGITGYTYHYPYAKIESFIANIDVTGVNIVGGIVGDYNTGTVARGILESGTITATGEDGVSGKVIGVSDSTDYSQDAYVLSSVENIGATNGLNGILVDISNLRDLTKYSQLSNNIIETEATGDINGTGYIYVYNQTQQTIKVSKYNN